MARKGENIYKRKDGRWEGRYIKSRSSTGKANYGYVYAKSYREVKAKLISQSSCTSNSVTVDPEISSDQFEQVAMEWFQAICPKVKESTSNKYRNLLSSYILPVFGSKQLRDITHEFIETQCNFFLVSGGLALLFYFDYIPSTHYMIRQLELFPNELDECWLAGRVFIEEEK